MRKYEKTHQFIRFQFRLPNDDPKLWLVIGEIASKCEHLAGVPLKPQVAERLHQIFLAKGVLATTAIEGNTLSEAQVMAELEGELELPPSQEYLQREIRNIIDLCNEEVSRHFSDGEESPHLCVDSIKSYNAGILRGLDLENEVIPGQVREHSVIVGNVYRGAPPEDCEYLLARLCQWLDGPDFCTDDEELKIPFAIVKAVIAHVYLAWIHPFGDGNGRTARMVEFHILFSSGIPLPAAHLLSDHYNATRSRYYRELDKASKSGGDLVPFLKYALQGFVDGIRGQLLTIREQQMEVAWENFVHEKFREEKLTQTQKRRRDLVLELANHGRVRVSSIPDLSLRLARAYATAGERMVQRDLGGLEKMQLVVRRHGWVTAKKWMISAFLPRRVEQEDDSE